MLNLVADFETTTLSKKEEEELINKTKTINDLKTEVWGWGITEVGRIEDEEIFLGTTIDSFIDTITSFDDDCTIYFHNLKFDGHFILSYLFKNGHQYDNRKKRKHKHFNTLINNMGQFYSITFYYEQQIITFIDSMKKLPYSIEYIGKSFHLQHQKIEVEQEFYTQKREPNHVLTEIEKNYIRGDIRVLSQALHILHHNNMTKMTTASNSLSNYIQSIGGDGIFRNRFPILDEEIDDDIKLAYRGGWSFVNNKIKEKTIKQGLVYDVNSMYPYVMYEKIMPYGLPLFYIGEYKQNKKYPLYIQELTCEFKLKENKIPTIQIKHDLMRYLSTEYPNESRGLTRLYLTNIDLELFLEHYYVYNLTYESGYMFKGGKGLFKEYIEYWSHIKENSTGALRELSKLMLNSLYGKFGTKTKIVSKEPYFENNIVKLKLSDNPETIDPIYSAVAVFTTSYGRDKVIRTAQENIDRFCYSDTDSCHFQGSEPLKIQTHQTKLGYWKCEGLFERAKFIGSKCYIEEFKNISKNTHPLLPKGQKSELKVTCAGMTKKQHQQVTFDNFKVGLKVHGKLQPKVIKGGVVLINVDYEVKVRNWR